MRIVVRACACFYHTFAILYLALNAHGVIHQREHKVRIVHVREKERGVCVYIEVFVTSVLPSPACCLVSGSRGLVCEWHPQPPTRTKLCHSMTGPDRSKTNPRRSQPPAKKQKQNKNNQKHQLMNMRIYYAGMFICIHVFCVRVCIFVGVRMRVNVSL